ncbi:putative dehydrogenase [Thioflavicoccus mobilis 8321]|uniref:Putative dehydrogenase n=1 Tax=Thioflavicoccus mobilis 8321 TaxID=765912 RepID=L0GV12_9GAMM|nr:bi-domain-containing oxidoreductase [Thioflavicoccus mobilis]AGA89831.1 putative dehydrogenase [Thioflavicoccus mobilis 8321]
MKQVLQSLKDGQTEVAEVPSPGARSGQLLIHTMRSLISAGTERMLLEFGQGSLLAKARKQPDKVRDVVAKARTDGVSATMEAVRAKLDQPIPLGYCNLGRVAEVGRGVTGFAPGDRVVSNGNHAEVVSVPKNLCAKVPDGVSDEAASFTVLAAIGLQGIRLARVTLGECVVVTGLGLIGLLTVQLLRAHGCRVLGIDLDPARLALARRFGAETVDVSAGQDPLAAAQTFSRGAGVDAVLITAATRSSGPVSQAAKMCRRRGRIVLVGVTGLELSRADFYEKELSFQVSCSYGPGRYDPIYEQGGQDYPIGFVRWTEQRNFEAVLDMLAAGALDVAPLVTHRLPIEQAAEALALLTEDRAAMGIVLEYAPDDTDERLARRRVSLAATIAEREAGPGRARVGFLGAGNYASRTLIPVFKAAGATLATVVSAGGVSALHAGRKNGVAEAATDEAACIDAPDIDAVVIATRHDLHARQVLAALRAGKHVYCEKPLCLTETELAEIEVEARARPGQLLMVGFNRRFAPQVERMKALLAAVPGPKSLILTVNAGAIQADHWTQDPAIGGGRIIGEACHFIDLARHLAGAPIVSHRVQGLGTAETPGPRDTAAIALGLADGSEATIHYLANGHKGFPKERIEVFVAGRVLQLDNFRTLRGWGWPGFTKMNLWKQDKGAEAAAVAFVRAIREGGLPPIPLAETLEASRISILAADAL